MSKKKMGILAMVACVGLGAGAWSQSKPAEVAAGAATVPAVVRAEDQGYRVKVVRIPRNQEQPGLESVTILFSSQTPEAWGGTGAEHVMYIDTDEKLLKAETEDGKDVAAALKPRDEFFAAAATPYQSKEQGGLFVFNHPAALAIGALDVGAKHHLTALAFEVTVVKVTQWRTITIKRDAGEMETKRDERIDCGGFHLRLTRAAGNIEVTSANYSVENHLTPYAVFFEKTPLHFLDYRYGAPAVEIRDAGGTLLQEMGGGGSGNSVSRRFGMGLAATLPAAGAIAFPITVTLRMPAKWEKQRVLFSLGKKELAGG